MFLVSDVNITGHLRDVKDIMIHETRTPSVPPWSRSDAHVPLMCSRQGSAWSLSLLCSCGLKGQFSAPYVSASGGWRSFKQGGLGVLTASMND